MLYYLLLCVLVYCTAMMFSFSLVRGLVDYSGSRLRMARVLLLVVYACV